MTGSGDTNGSGTNDASGSSAKDKGADSWTVADHLAATLRGNRALAGLAALLAEVLFGGWFVVAATSTERIVAGLIFAIVLLVLVYLAMLNPSAVRSRPDPGVAKAAKQLRGGWTIDSHPVLPSQLPEGVGTADIQRVGPSLSITGTVDQPGGLGFDFSSESAWISENELVFCYTFEQAGNRRRALTVLRLPSEPHPTRLEGTWFVAGDALNGKVVYTRPTKPPTGG